MEALTIIGIVIFLSCVGLAMTLFGMWLGGDDIKDSSYNAPPQDDEEDEDDFD